MLFCYCLKHTKKMSVDFLGCSQMFLNFLNDSKNYPHLSKKSQNVQNMSKQINMLSESLHHSPKCTKCLPKCSQSFPKRSKISWINGLLQGFESWWYIYTVYIYIYTYIYISYIYTYNMHAYIHMSVLESITPCSTVKLYAIYKHVITDLHTWYRGRVGRGVLRTGGEGHSYKTGSSPMTTSWRSPSELAVGQRVAIQIELQFLRRGCLIRNCTEKTT